MKENRSMKKSFLVLCLIIIVCLSACGGSTAVIQNTASSAATEPMITIESTIPDIPVMTQRHILENNQSLWEFSDPFESPWFYTYTDLDHNGRLEVIAGMKMSKSKGRTIGRKSFLIHFPVTMTALPIDTIIPVKV